MPDLFYERHVPHLPERMFELIGDLESYPRFIPNCKSMLVKPDRSSPGDVLAKMTIRFGPITQSYTSRVTRDADALTIAAKAVDGPFAYLDSKWRLDREGEGTRVRFDIDFKFNNGLLAKIADPAFSAKQDEIVEAFVQEADRRFGG